MNEFVFVEFMYESEVAERISAELDLLGEDFVLINSHMQGDDARWHPCTSGKINAAAATAIKLGNKFLADRMHISYIPSELKDKYRNR